MTHQEIRQSLLARDPEFRSLAEEHSRCQAHARCRRWLGGRSIDHVRTANAAPITKDQARL